MLSGSLPSILSASIHTQASTYFEDCSGLYHFCHESRYALQLAVTSANPTEDGIKDGCFRLVTGDETANLCHQGDNPNLRNLVSLDDGPSTQVSLPDEYKCSFLPYSVQLGIHEYSVVKSAGRVTYD